MNSILTRYCLPISIIASTFGMLLHLFLFGRSLLGDLQDTGLILLLVFGFLPGIILSPVFRRWNGPLFIVGNVAMFISGWCIVLFFPNIALPSYADIGIPLGIYLGGTVLVVGTGLQYCLPAEHGESHRGLRMALVIFGALACVIFLPYLKITIGYTAYFTVSALFSSMNLLLFALSGGIRGDFVSNDIGTKRLASPGNRSIGCITTLFVVVGALLVAQVTYYLGQDTLYAAERTVLVWPFAAAAAGVYAIVRIFTSKIFAPLVLFGVTLVCVLLMLAGPPYVYGWWHAALVGITYAFALISYSEAIPHWIPNNPRRVGPFYALIGFFTVLGIAAVGYIGGIPIHTEELPPVIGILPYFCGVLLLASMIQIYCLYKIKRKEENL